MATAPAELRTTVKRHLARVGGRRPGYGTTILIYHRVGGGTRDELDTPPDRFRAQVDVLAHAEVVALDDALDALAAGDTAPRVVLTFDDGFDDVYRHAWPLLRERHLPFTVYLASAYISRPMRWEGGSGAGTGRGLTWDQLAEMVASGLCTVGNHTHEHVPAAQLDAAQVDRCSDLIEAHLGVRPRHFAYPWGVVVPGLDHELRARFRSAATGRLGRVRPGDDLLRLARVPVRRTDPLSFFEAKLRGRLVPERLYGALVGAAKRLGMTP